MMINFILSFLDKLWFSPIRKAQKEYRRDHILNKYDENCDWKDNIFW